MQVCDVGFHLCFDASDSDRVAVGVYDEPNAAYLLTGGIARIRILGVVVNRVAVERHLVVPSVRTMVPHPASRATTKGSAPAINRR